MEKLELNVRMEHPTAKNLIIDQIKFQKMTFIFNAINDGWTIKKNDDYYVFYKKHEGKKEIFTDDYLLSFLSKNCDVNTLLS
jgi:hypothetical protein